MMVERGVARLQVSHGSRNMTYSFIHPSANIPYLWPGTPHTLDASHGGRDGTCIKQVPRQAPGEALLLSPGHRL